MNKKSLTYRELKELLAKIIDKDLDQTATVVIRFEDNTISEVYPIKNVDCLEDSDGILDSFHWVLEI